MNLDLQKLYDKALQINQQSQSIDRKRQIINQIKDLQLTKLQETKRTMLELATTNDRISKGKDTIRSNKPQPTPQMDNTVASHRTQKTKSQYNKNPGVGDVDKMMYEKKFKNFLNHREQFREKAKKRIEKISKKGKGKIKLQPGEQYYNEDQVLSNTGSDYQYADSSEMMAAYEQIATGKRQKKGGLQLFLSAKFQYAFRVAEFQIILEILEGDQQNTLIPKDLLLQYLFEVPCIMMLYSINPFTLADQLADFETQVPQLMSFEQYSNFLLIDREPTYFEYTKQNLQEAKKLGRGLKCAPIVGLWIGGQDLLEEIIEVFLSVDVFGGGNVQRAVLAKKLHQFAQQKRLLDTEVIQIVNIGKKLPLNRLIYEIQHQSRDNQNWTLVDFRQYLEHYYRLQTPDKDKLITKLIMAGKYDPSYIYIVSPEVNEIFKQIFAEMQKFAQFFVVKEKFIIKVCKHPKYKKIKELPMRSETNRYVVKETVEQTLSRIMNEGDEYLDIQEILDFLTNRGRPRVIEYKVYLANLQKQLEVIEAQQQLKWGKLQQGEQLSTSSDQEYAKQLKQRRIKRKKNKIAQIRNANNYKAQKKFNVTVPVSFAFQSKYKNKKQSIRERKVKEMLQQKQRKINEAMKPIKPKQVPQFVKDNLFQRIMKDQERQRQQRLEKFRLQIENSMAPVSEHLIRPIGQQVHCDFSHQQYKFVARPMPWYCQVNLLDRINRQKQQRRQQILQMILNRHQDNDLPEGVLRMLKRHQEIMQKRKHKKAGTGLPFRGDCTFIPKISHKIPDFKTMHEHLNINLQIAKERYQPIQVQPFSFENRPKKERRQIQTKPVIKKLEKSIKIDENQQRNIPKTQKFKSLVELRRKQEEQRIRKQLQAEKADQIRKMRRQKFAPLVHSVLKKKDNQLGGSRQQIEQNIRKFRQNQRKRKQQYEQDMINIYTRVFNRPLLVQSTGHFGQNQVRNYQQDMGDNEIYNQPKHSPDKQKRKVVQPSKKPQNVDKMRAKQYQEMRKQMIENEPGQYMLQHGEQPEQHHQEYDQSHNQTDSDRYNEVDFEQEIDQPHYTN